MLTPEQTSIRRLDRENALLRADNDRLREKVLGLGLILADISEALIPHASFKKRMDLREVIKVAREAKKEDL